eukprot:SM000038S14293  [mRNA]  locus=s38:47087:48048:- [translate_table: standard]
MCLPRYLAIWPSFVPNTRNISGSLLHSTSTLLLPSPRPLPHTLLATQWEVLSRKSSDTTQTTPPMPSLLPASLLPSVLPQQQPRLTFLGSRSRSGLPRLLKPSQALHEREARTAARRQPAGLWCSRLRAPTVHFSLPALLTATKLGAVIRTGGVTEPLAASIGNNAAESTDDGNQAHPEL